MKKKIVLMMVALLCAATTTLASDDTFDVVQYIGGNPAFNEFFVTAYLVSFPQSVLESTTYDFTWIFDDGYYSYTTYHTSGQDLEVTHRLVMEAPPHPPDLVVKILTHLSGSIVATMEREIIGLTSFHVKSVVEPGVENAQFGYLPYYVTTNGVEFQQGHNFSLCGSTNAVRQRVFLMESSGYGVRATDIPPGYLLTDIEFNGGDDPQVDLDRREATFLGTPTITFHYDAPVWYVATNSPANGPGTAWSNAFHSIQAGVDAAAEGGTVLVTNGVYNIGGTVVDGMNYRVAVSNDVVVRSVNGPEYTTIAGGGGYGPSAVRCAFLTNNTELTGFTLSDGYTHNATGTEREKNGGGAWLEPDSLLSNCVVTACEASGCGGGIYFNQGGVARNCTIHDCRGTGGGVYCSGGGLLENCLITANGSGGYSGGMEGSGTLRSCAIVDNWSNGHAGGMRCYSGALLENCTIAGNSADGDMGGAQLNAGVTLHNTIIYSNTAGGSYPDYRDSGATNEYCCAPGFTGTGSITNAPQFVDATNGNYRLMYGSPCINTGNNASVEGSIDLDGSPRIVNATVDMGAYEYDGATYNSDSDAFTDDAEITADTDPLNSNDYFHVTSFSNGVVFFDSSNARWYTLLGCTNLLSNDWKPVSVSRVGAGGSDFLQSTNSLPIEFYKLTVELP